MARFRQRGGPEAAEQALQADVHPDEPPGEAHPRQVEVAGAHHPHAVHVDELPVEDVTAEHHLAAAPLEVAQVQPGGAQQHPVGLDRLHLRDRQVGRPTPDVDDEARGGRVGAAVPAGHDVGHLADLGARLVGDRVADEPCE